MIRTWHQVLIFVKSWINYVGTEGKMASDDEAILVDELRQNRLIVLNSLVKG